MSEQKQEAATKDTVSTAQEQPKKSKAGKTILIVLLVIVLLVGLCGGGAYFLYQNFVAEIVEDAEEAVDEVDSIFDVEIDEFEEDTGPTTGVVEDEDEEEVSDDPRVDEELANDDVISERFPDDIPLSGGTVTSSSFDQWSVVVEISTSSNVEDAYKWYEDALEDTDWVITSKSRDDDSASISFDNGKERRDDDYRSAEISIRSWEWRDYTGITVRERY